MLDKDVIHWMLDDLQLVLVTNTLRAPMIDVRLAFCTCSRISCTVGEKGANGGDSSAG